MLAYLLSVYIGIGIHAEDLDYPEVQGLDNPIGIVRLEQKVNERVDGYCEHISSIPTWEQGYGFNHCGFTLRIK